jgi:putative hydrolase of the HAD superfamily
MGANLQTPLRAIFFDIDDTLFSTTAFVERARENAIQAMLDRGLNAEKTDLLLELQSVVMEFGSNDTRHYNRLLQRLPQEATRGCSTVLLVMAGVMAYHETKWKELHLREEAISLLQDLSQTNLRLGVITAGLRAKQMEKILRLGIDSWVDPNLIFITDEMGIAKNNSKLYLECAARAGIPPEFCLHVGDHPFRDMDTAQEAGFHTIWHRGSGKYADLREPRPADQVVTNLEDVRRILEKEYGLSLG